MKRLLEGVAMVAAIGVVWAGWIAVSLVVTIGLALVLLLLSNVPIFAFLAWVAGWAYKIASGGIAVIVGAIVVAGYVYVCLGTLVGSALCIFKRQWPLAIKFGSFALVIWSPVLLLIYLTVWAG